MNRTPTTTNACDGNGQGLDLQEISKPDVSDPLTYGELSAISTKAFDQT